MTLRNFVSTAPDTTLNGGIDNVQTSLVVASSSGYPTVPFTAAVQPDSSQEELVEVTNVSGTTWTVTRGIDGTGAISHTNGVTVRHVASARDFNEANAHINATTNVHGTGASNAVVGTGTAQTLTNKTYSGGTLSGTLAGTPTFSGAALFTGDPVFEDGSAANPVLLARVQSDGTPRFAVNADGKIEFGPGNAARDTNLYRDAAGNKLKTDDAFDIVGALGVLGGASLVGNLSGTPTFTGAALFNGVPKFEGTGTSDVLQARAAGDTNGRVKLRADGHIVFGTGGVTQDVELYRNGADSLFTPDAFEALTLAANGKPARIIKIESQQSKVTTSTTFGTTNVTVTSLSVTGDGTTKVKVTISWAAIQTQASGASNCAVYIFRGATQIGRASVYTAQGTTDVAGGSLSITDTPANGANTYSFQVVRIGGDTGTQLVATSASPSELIVEQFGG